MLALEVLPERAPGERFPTLLAWECGDAAVQRLDLLPQAAQVEDVARHRERARDVRACRPRLLAETEDERRSGPVHEAVRDLGGDDLATEWMPPQPGAEALARGGREIALELAGEVRIVRKLGREQLSIEGDLRIREEDRELGRGQSLSGRLALGQ